MCWSRARESFNHNKHESGNCKNAGTRLLALSADKNLHKTDNGLFCTCFTYISPTSPKWLSSGLMFIIPLCLPCNQVLRINTRVELQLKIMRLYWANVLACSKWVWANCRSRIGFFFSPILLHFDWWIGTLNKGFRCSLNERYRASTRHTQPRKKSNLFFLELSWLASSGPESTVQASIEGKMWFYDFHVIPVSSYFLSPGSFYKEDLSLSPETEW